MRWCLLCLVICCLSMAGGALADESLPEQISRQLSAEQPIVGRFEQTRQLRGFERALRSQGRFEVDPQKRIRWDTETPFPVTLVVTPEKIVERTPDGQSTVLSDASHDGAASVSRVLFALLAGRVTELGDYFSLSGEIGSEGWQLQLAPSSSNLKEVIERIQMRGGRFVESVEIYHRNGDETRLRLFELRHAPDEQR